MSTVVAHREIRTLHGYRDYACPSIASQCPPLAGPTCFSKFSALMRLICHATPFGVSPNSVARSPVDNGGFSLISGKFSP